MKKRIILGVFFALTLFLSSCGGVSSLEGKWKIDPSSIDLVLGEGFPEQMKQGVERAKEEAKSKEAKEQADKVTLSLLADGKAIISHEDHLDESKEFNWKQTGKILNFNGEFENEKFNFNLDILSSSKEETTIGFTGESFLEQIRAERPDILEEIPPMFDLEKMVKGAKVSVTLNKAP